MILNKTFSAKIIKDTETSGWICALWPDSASILGTGKTVKISAAIDGYDFLATLMPFGNGTHMLPLRAALMKAIGKQIGDSVEVLIRERF